MREVIKDRFAVDVSVPHSIYLVERCVLNTLENEVSNAIRYVPFTFTFTEDSAKSFVATGKYFTKSDCWAIREPLKEFRYVKVKHINIL